MGLTKLMPMHDMDSLGYKLMAWYISCMGIFFVDKSFRHGIV